MGGNQGVNFVAENPALGGMEHANSIIGGQTVNDLNDMRLQELMRTRDAEHAIDQYMREQSGVMGQPQGGQPVDLNTVSMGPQPAAAAPAPGSMQARHPEMDFRLATPGGGQMPATTPVQPETTASMAPSAGAPAAAGAPPAQPVDLSTMAMNSRPVSPARISAGFDRVALAKRLGQQGFGSEAIGQLGIAQQEQQAQQDAQNKQQDYYVTNYFKSLENNDAYSAKYWGGKAGMDTPDDVLHDVDFQKFMGTASKWKEFYGSDLQGFHDFTQTALALHKQNDPDAFTKAYQANPPTVKAAKGAFDDKNAEINYLMKNLHYTQDQAAAAVGLSPTGGGTGRGGKGNVGVAQWKYNTYLANHPGDTVGAEKFANGEKAIGFKDAMKMATDLIKAQLDKGGGFEHDMPIEQRAHDMAVKLMSGDDTFAQGTDLDPNQPADSGTSFDLAQKAYAAIAAGKDAAAVKDRYKRLTGQDLPEQGTQ